jgi:ADP-heptose:LPS heptosyltransferase
MSFLNLYKIKYFLKTLTCITIYPLVFLVNHYIKKKNFFFLFSQGKSIGDNVVITGLISQVKKNTDCNIVLFSLRKEVFENNPNIFKIIDLNNHKFLFYILILFQGTRIIEFNTKTYPHIDIFDLLRKKSKKKYFKHISEVIGGNLSKYINFGNFKNEIYLSNKEQKKFEKKFSNILLNKYSIILPYSKKTMTPIRNWGFDKYQKLVNLVNINWVQAGAKNEKPLENIVNLKDTTIRELFFLVKNSSFVLSNDGSLNHIANSFNVTSFVIMSGFTNSEFIKYRNSIIISREPQIECAPCYLKEPCYREKQFCIEDISIEIVKKKIIDYINKQ